MRHRLVYARRLIYSPLLTLKIEALWERLSENFQTFSVEMQKAVQLTDSFSEGCAALILVFFPKVFYSTDIHKSPF